MGQFGYACNSNKCGDHQDDFDYITPCVVRVGNVYVKGEYDGFGGVVIDVDTNTGYGSPKKRTVYAYHEQFRSSWFTWNIDKESLLATEIYCNGKAGHHPARSLQAFLLKKEDPFDGNGRFCAPKGVRIQDSLHVWHLASLPKALSSTTTRIEKKSLCEMSMNTFNVPKKKVNYRSKKTKKANVASTVFASPEEW